jgi:hypothetical protein
MVEAAGATSLLVQVPVDPEIEPSPEHWATHDEPDSIGVPLPQLPA